MKTVPSTTHSEATHTTTALKEGKRAHMAYAETLSAAMPPQDNDIAEAVTLTLHQDDEEEPTLPLQAPPPHNARQRRTSFPPNVLLGGRYINQGLLGEGGMGQVYQVWDREREVQRALKVLWHTSTQSAQRRPELAQEFLALCHFRHPHIVSVHDFGYLSEGMAYFTMEYVEGHTFSRYRGAPHHRYASALIEDILRALAAIHSQGMLHGDLKPGNVMVTRENGEQPIAKLADFGLAMLIENVEAGSVQGTPSYIAPELLRQESVDGRSDLYALGIMLFELWTGHMPFAHPSMIEIFRQHLFQPPPAPSSLNPHIPKVWEEVILRLLAKQPALRYGSAEEVLHALQGRKIYAAAADNAEANLHTIQSVGREVETETFNHHFARLPEQGNWLLLQGPPGVGKSHLLESWRISVQVSGGQWLQFPPSPDTPFSPLPSLWRGLASRCPELQQLEEAAALLEGAPLTPKTQRHQCIRQSSPSEERMQLFHQIASQLQQLTCQHKIALVIDPIENASDDLLALLSYLNKHCTPQPFLWIIAGREQSDNNDTLTLSSRVGIPLSPLSRDAVEQLLSWTLGHVEEHTQLAHHLYQESNGNPLLITELLRSMIEDRFLRSSQRGWWFNASGLADRSIPHDQDAVTALLSRRLQQCPPLQQTLLRVVALIGGQVPESLLWEVVGPSLPLEQPPETLQQALDELLQKGLLRHEQSSEGQFFALVPSSFEVQLRAEMQEQESCRWHRRLYDVLSAHQRLGRKINCASLARHALRAGDHQIAGQLLLRAGAAFVASRAFSEGYRFFIELFEVMARQGDALRAAQALEQASYLAGHLGQTNVSKQLLEHALAQLQNEPIQGTPPTSLHPSPQMAPNPCPYDSHDSDLPDLHLADAPKATKQHRWTARIIRQLGHISDKSGQFDKALDYYRQSLALLEEDFVDTRPWRKERQRLWRSIGWSLMKLAQYQEAQEAVEKALDEAMALGEAVSLCQIYRLRAGIAFYRGDAELVHTSAQKALEIACEANDERGQAEAYFTFGNFANLSGRFDEAIHSFTQAKERFASLGLLEAIGRCLNNLGVASYQKGDWAQAIHYWERFAAICERLGDRTQLVNALNNFGFLYKDRGAFQQARHTIEQALQISLEDGLERFEATLRGNLGEILWRIGEEDAAREQLHNAIEKAKSLDAEHEVIENQRRRLAIDMTSQQTQYQDRISLEFSLKKLLKRATKRQVHSEQGHLQRLLGELWLLERREQDALHAFSEAKIIFKNQGATYEKALCEAGLARAYKQRKQMAQANTLARMARQCFQDLGASADLRMLNQAFEPP